MNVIPYYHSRSMAFQVKRHGLTLAFRQEATMSTELPSTTRRKMLVGSAAVGATGLLASHLAAAAAVDTSSGQPSSQEILSTGKAEDIAIRPFRFTPPTRRLATSPADRRDEMAFAGIGTGCVARRAIRDDARTRALLGDRLRLAQGRGEAERPAAIHDRDRRAGHSFHPCSFAAPNALPVIVTHGWPGSIIEQLKIIEPLTNPTAHGGTRVGRLRRRDSVIAGLWVFGKPTALGWDPVRIARAWIVLMKRLGYTRYVAQGGDWGTPSPSRWRC